jgi:molybdopterin-dependent oxidoreductase alpha subunit
MFGTKMSDDFFGIHTGGDIAFLNGVMKILLAEGQIDRAFVREHTTGFDRVLHELEGESFADLEAASGATRADMERFARMYARAKSAVLIWSMGITQHANGIDNVTAIVNLALARGNVGRKGAGLMPIRGHSGVQGGSEMGAYATALPGGIAVDEANAAALAETYGIPIGARPGLTADAMVEAAARGRLEVLYSSGGNFLDVLPDPASVEDALERVPVRVHQDIFVSSQMLVDPGEVVVLFPACTRYEQRGGGTETTTERRVLFSPEIPGPRIGEARSEWEIFADLGRRVRPDRAHLLDFADADAVRDEIAAVVPAYGGVDQLRKLGDQVQWGGTRLCANGVFPTPDGKARFLPVAPAPRERPDRSFVLSTRRGKQFNSMVHENTDPLCGTGRQTVLMAGADAARLGVADGDPVMLRNEVGEMTARVFQAPVAVGTLQVHWPEAEVLIDRRRRSPQADIPDYNAVVEVVSIR